MSVLESISMVIGAVLLILWAIIIAAFAWAWLSYQRAERKQLKAAAEKMAAWHAERAAREKHATTISTARVERHFVVPIDAETDAEAVEAIIAYSRAA